MTEQDKQQLLQLRDDVIYFTRRTEDAQINLQRLMAKLNLPGIEITIKDVVQQGNQP